MADASISHRWSERLRFMSAFLCAGERPRSPPFKRALNNENEQGRSKNRKQQQEISLPEVLGREVVISDRNVSEVDRGRKLANESVNRRLFRQVERGRNQYEQHNRNDKAVPQRFSADREKA